MENKKEKFFQKDFFLLIHEKKDSSQMQRSSVSYPGIDVLKVTTIFLQAKFLHTLSLPPNNFLSLIFLQIFPTMNLLLPTKNFLLSNSHHSISFLQ